MENRIFHAHCDLKGETDDVVGFVKFVYNEDQKKTNVMISVKGLKPGNHGVHIHQDFTKGSMGGGMCYNPLGATKHGDPNSTERHMGDMGNISAVEDKEITTWAYEDYIIQVNGPYSIIGKTVVVHENEDDLGKGASEESQKNGNVGPPLFSGIILPS